MEKMKLYEDERLEDLGNGLEIIQNNNKFRFGIDAVLLADFCAPLVKRKSKVCEVGTGTGVIPLLLSARSRFERLDAFEIQQDMAEMASRSVELNGLTDRIKIHAGDFREQEIFGPNSLDVIVSNPPYTPVIDWGEEPTRVIVNPNESLAIARHELKMSIDDLYAFANSTLKQGGKLVIIHRPWRFGELIAKAKDHRLAAKRARFIHSNIDKEASMVLVEFTRDGKDYLRVEKPLIIYDGDGNYTDEINEIYGTDGPSRTILK